jgi:tight adherence protein B
MKNIQRHHLIAVALFATSWLIFSSITKSSLLAFPIAAGLSLLPIFLQSQAEAKRHHQLIEVWPEIIDHIISGLRSGLSIAETVLALSERGPVLTRELFTKCSRRLKSSGNFSDAFDLIRLEFKDPIADQVCETLEISRRNGGRDTTVILRTLGDFVRNDIALRSEIRAKHGWIKNSAIIATLAPWILLLILSSQPTTIAAFSTATGVFVLIMGALMSIAGFLWMSRIGRIQEIPRVFRGAIPQKSDVISHE